MSRLTEAPGQEDLLFLPGAVRLQWLIKLAPGKAQLPQDGLEKGLLRPALPDEVLQLSPEKGGVLGQHGHRQAAGAPDLAGVRDVLPQQQLEEAGLPRPVGPPEGHPVSPLHGEGDSGAYRSRPVVDGEVPDLQHLPLRRCQGIQL